MIVNSIYTKLVQQCLNKANVNIKSMNCAEFARNFPNIPVIYLYSKRDEFVECSDSMEIFDKLSTNFKYFLDIQAKHNESRKLDKICRIFGLYRELKDKKEKKRRMSKIKNQRKFSASNKRIVNIPGPKETHFKKMTKKHMSTGNLLKIKEDRNEDLKSAKKTIKKEEYLIKMNENSACKKSSEKKISISKPKSLYHNIQKRLSKERNKLKSSKKKISKPPKIKIKRHFSEIKNEKNENKSKKKRPKKQPITKHSFLSDNPSKRIILLPKNDKNSYGQQKNNFIQVTPKDLKKIEIEVKNKKIKDNNNNLEKNKSIQINLNNSNRTDDKEFFEFEYKLDVGELAEKFDGLQSEIRMFEIPKTKNVNFLQDIKSDSKRENIDSHKNYFNNRKNVPLKRQNNTKWKKKPINLKLESRENIKNDYVKKIQPSKGKSQDPIYISPQNIEQKIKPQYYIVPQVKNKTLKKVEKVKSKSIGFEQIKNYKTDFKIIKHSKFETYRISSNSNTTNLPSQSESILEKNQQKIVYKYSYDPSKKKKAVINVNKNKLKHNSKNTFIQKKEKNPKSIYPNQEKNEIQPKNIKPQSKSKKKIMYVTKNSGRNVQSKVIISYPKQFEREVHKIDSSSKKKKENKYLKKIQIGRFNEKNEKINNFKNQIFLDHKIYRSKKNIESIYKHYMPNEDNELEKLKQKVIRSDFSNKSLKNNVKNYDSNDLLSFFYKNYRFNSNSNNSTTINKNIEDFKLNDFLQKQKIVNLRDNKSNSKKFIKNQEKILQTKNNIEKSILHRAGKIKKSNSSYALLRNKISKKNIEKTNQNNKNMDAQKYTDLTFIQVNNNKKKGKRLLYLIFRSRKKSSI